MLKFIDKYIKSKIKEIVIEGGSFSQSMPWTESAPLRLDALAKEGYRKNGILFSGIDYIANKASETKIKVGKKLANGEIEILEDHDLIDAMENTPDFLDIAIRFYTLFGNTFSYAKKFNPKDKDILSFVYLFPQNITIEAKLSSYGEFYMSRLHYTFVQEHVFDDTQNIFHFKTWNASPLTEANYMFGMSPFVPASKIIKAYNEGNDSLVYMYQNSGGSSLVTPKGEGYQQDDVSISQSIKDKLRGKSKTGNIAYINTPLDKHDFSRKFNELGIIETITMGDREILNVLGLPSEMFNDPENKTNSNKEVAQVEAVYKGVIPKVGKFCSALQRFARSNYDDPDLVIIPDFSNIREIQMDTLQIMEKLNNINYLTLNEKRNYSNMFSSLHIPEADAIIINNELWYV